LRCSKWRWSSLERAQARSWKQHRHLWNRRSWHVRLVDTGTLLLTGIKISTVMQGDSGPQTFIPKLISLYQAGLFPFDKLVKKYDFADINTAFSDSEEGTTLKPVLVF